MDTEKRLIWLEETVAFQERLYESLNSALLEQQRQLDRLEQIMGKQELALLALKEALAETATPLAQEKPPHY